ncbi:hypothetical protein TIFTF001_020340 [Ficus carica]|uniref:Uncharacterized protein n=1 Tax=Ficus carica TaxID=3494 RepID=A0AA88D9R8_FICCA|nr:hypothetical protein TIFTF001_020340 [Ficus carica]
MQASEGRELRRRCRGGAGGGGRGGNELWRKLQGGREHRSRQALEGRKLWRLGGDELRHDFGGLLLRMP